jgi:magnesium chelatase subunit D
MYTNIYPFSAIVGQDQLKLALILNAVNPAVGGVLIKGEKGTAKSTTVRALSVLLPEIKVNEECAYSCDPDDEKDLCDRCRQYSGEDRSIRRKARVITLPLNATEDRVSGGIDFNLAIRKGARMLQPGLLADAHRGILYVDEVNLLDDHIVDIILDAAGSGHNVIEREGISYSHASRFILVGTMNPEEGELRPQLLDRFGLCVEVQAVADKDKRILTMERRESYDTDPSGFIEEFEKENAAIAGSIDEARKRLSCVSMHDHLRALCAELCNENNVAGHRADLVMEQAARALAAYRDHPEVTEEDIREVAIMALVHRKRDAAPPPPPPPPPEHEHDHDHDDSHEEEENPEQEEQQEESSKEQQAEDSTQEEAPPPDENENDSEQEPEEKENNRHEDVLEQIFDVGETFKVKKFSAPKDRVFRRGSGRRSRSRISQKQGRYVKSSMGRESGDIALDATLRAAAPYQLRRKNGGGLSVILKNEDIREKVREKRIGNFLLFLVDASGSMGARGRMVASKGAIMSLLLDAYQKRDRIAMITFRKDEAAVNLPPTSSIELAANLLKEMPVGGRTPLSAGLVRSYEVLRNYLMREPTARPIVIMVTDGKANVSLGEKKPFDEAIELAVRMSLEERARFIVVDTESQGLVNFGLASRLAGAMNAQYFKTDDLKADTLINIVKGEV